MILSKNYCKGEVEVRFVQYRSKITTVKRISVMVLMLNKIVKPRYPSNDNLCLPNSPICLCLWQKFKKKHKNRANVDDKILLQCVFWCKDTHIGSGMICHRI